MDELSVYHPWNKFINSLYNHEIGHSILKEQNLRILEEDLLSLRKLFTGGCILVDEPYEIDNKLAENGWKLLFEFLPETAKCFLGIKDILGLDTDVVKQDFVLLFVPKAIDQYKNDINVMMDKLNSSFSLVHKINFWYEMDNYTGGYNLLFRLKCNRSNTLGIEKYSIF